MASGSFGSAPARATHTSDLRVGREGLSLASLLALARGEARAVLDPDPAYRARLRRAQRAVEQHVEAGHAVYGVTTGVGASLGKQIPVERREDMPHHLLRMHGCGTGRILEETEAAAVLVARLVSLAQCHSGVRVELLERLCELLNQRVLPRIPAEGSVGASGDLTPLSYLAAALIGEREVSYRGEVVPSAEAHAALGWSPLRLRPKESLALMNGTSVMTALGCLAVDGAQRLARLASTVTAMAVDVMHGNRAHFDARIADWKPHPGQQCCAAWIREHLEYAPTAPGPAPARLQDRYSIRCAPHVIGVLVEAAETAQRTLEIELNGVDDNPLVDPETGDVLHGGNFYGGHVCFVLDGLKAAVASVADLLDRQLSLLCTPATSDGLPADLVAEDGHDAVAHHGFKAMQISASALTAEALKLTMPAGSFSRSTESHNQDKVSMGTIAARDAQRVLELTETVAAIGLLAVCQAVDLRGGSTLRRTRAMHAAVREAVPRLDEDRRQDHDIAAVLALHRDGALPGGSPDVG